MVKLKRIYNLASKSDGFRILVDRLWPRGLTKERAKINLWLKEIAPSDKIRKSFSHNPKKWPEFKKNYKKELKNKKELIVQIKQLFKKHKIITLLFAAKDEKYNNAVVLKDFLKIK